MNIFLLEKIFINSDVRYTLDEAKEVAKLVFDTAMKLDIRNIGNCFGDYWIQIGHDWDLNIFFNDVEGKWTASLYEVADGIVDDTQNPIHFLEEE